jgi:hypothetical protein
MGAVSSQTNRKYSDPPEYAHVKIVKPSQRIKLEDEEEQLCVTKMLAKESGRRQSGDDRDDWAACLLFLRAAWCALIDCV